MISRRSFMGSILALAAAPAIVRADSLMRIVPRDTNLLPYDTWARQGDPVVHEGGFVEVQPAIDAQFWTAFALAPNSALSMTLPNGHLMVVGNHRDELKKVEVWGHKDGGVSVKGDVAYTLVNEDADGAIWMESGYQR